MQRGVGVKLLEFLGDRLGVLHVLSSLGIGNVDGWAGVLHAFFIGFNATGHELVAKHIAYRVALVGPQLHTLPCAYLLGRDTPSKRSCRVCLCNSAQAVLTEEDSVSH